MENEKTNSSADSNTALLNFIEEVTSNCGEEQQKVLVEILSQNNEVEYLKRHGIPKGCIDKHTFKSNVPIVSYEDIQPDILRIANGDTTPILCAHRITGFFRSSGTSGGEQKLIPTTAESMAKRHLLYSLPLPVITKYIQGLDKGKSLHFLMSKDQEKTPSGLIIQAVSTAYLRSPYFMDSSQCTYTSPIESIHCFDHFQSMYTQLLCGLYQRHDVVRVGASFASTLVTVINFFKAHYSEIALDIGSGVLSPKITDPSLRACVSGTFMARPDPVLAEFVNSVCDNGRAWEGIIPKLWPNAKYIETRVTGSMAQYIPSVEYYGGRLPIVSHRYGMSECASGVNLNPMCNTYDETAFTLIPNMAYFELLPVKSEEIESDDEPVDLVNAEIGKEYELLLTTYTGLYRYRTEDILCPTGYYNSTPQFKFIRRKNVLLSIDTDKTTESELLKAIETVSVMLKSYNTIVSEYTSYAEINTNPGHYMIYLELFIKNPEIELTKDVMEQCCLAMEDSLSTLYRRCRASYKTIGPLEIRVVKGECFEKLRDYSISRGTSLFQYKTPRCLKRLPMVKLLDTGVISTHFSTSLPRFSSSDRKFERELISGAFIVRPDRTGLKTE